MKKLLLILLPLILLVTVAGASYLPRWLRDRTAPTVPVDRAGASLSQSLDQQVSLREAEVTKQPDSEEARCSLVTALFKRGEATGNSADFDRAWKELARAEALAPDSFSVAVLRAQLMRSNRRFRQKAQKASLTTTTASQQSTSTRSIQSGAPRARADQP